MHDERKRPVRASSRWLWFIGLWMAGVAGLGVASLLLRWVMKAAGLGG